MGIGIFRYKGIKVPRWYAPHAIIAWHRAPWWCWQTWGVGWARWRRWTWDTKSLSPSAEYDGHWAYQTDEQRAHGVLMEKCDGGV